MIDGASRWQIFRDMTFPLMRPALAVAGTFTFLEVWNEFVLALILTGPRTKTVPIGLSEFITEHAVEWGPMRYVTASTSVGPPPFRARASAADVSR